jgi:Na+-transporting NADH:ubiquinone oxidoreductase subunit C
MKKSLLSEAKAALIDMMKLDGEISVDDAVAELDLAKTTIRQHLQLLEQYGLVYLKKNAAGDVETAVIPVRGYGLWGTLYGFLALEQDFETVAGIGFYEHKETPGLGGEIENPSWKAIWEGKEVFDDSGNPAIDVTKSMAPPGNEARKHQIDSLSGATMTSRGVENLVNFWVGEMGYGPYLKSMKQGNA